MSLGITRLAKNLFRRHVNKSATPARNRARLSVTTLEDRTVPTPVVTIAAIADATEGGASGTFRLTRTETAGTLNVGYSPSGTAGPYTDYTYPLSARFADG